jgi:hypothetical protein
MQRADPHPHLRALGHCPCPSGCAAGGAASRRALRGDWLAGAAAAAQVRMSITTSFEQLGAVYNCMDKHQAERESEEYQAGGDLEIVVQVAADAWEQLQDAVGNATSGRVVPRRMED